MLHAKSSHAGSCDDHRGDRYQSGHQEIQFLVQISKLLSGGVTEGLEWKGLMPQSLTVRVNQATH